MRTKPMPLEKTIRQDYFGGINPSLSKDLYGVEVELEGRGIKTTKQLVVRDWAQHQDGSLRVADEGDQAVEYVFKKPMTLAEATDALSNLFNHLNGRNVQVYESHRTSIHVHVNFLDDTYRTFYNFITLAIIFDELFVSQNGENRQGNNFCLRVKDAEGLLRSLIESTKAYGNPINIARDERYSSINVTSLTKFGSVEFRSLECTGDLERVMHWLTVLHTMKLASRTFTDPREIIRQFSSAYSETEFLTKILGKNLAAKYLFVPGKSDMLRRGMRLAQDLAFCSEWIAEKQADTTSEVIKNPYNGAGAGGQLVVAPEWARGEPLGFAQWVVNNVPEPAVVDDDDEDL